MVPHLLLTMPATPIEFPKASDEKTCVLPGWRIPPAAVGAYQDCCLVIATHNRPAEVLDLIDGLSQRKDVPGEIVIADSSLGCCLNERLRIWSSSQAPRPFDLVYVHCPPGLTLQRNIGIDISTREFVFFLDDDARPLENYFYEIRQVFVRDSEKRVGAVGGSVVNEMNRPVCRRWRVRLSIGLVPKVEPMMYDSCGTSTPKGLINGFQGVRRVEVLPGCAFAFRREVLELHRFSSFFGGYSQGEDLEMSLRVGANWEVVCSGDAEVVHQVAPGGRPTSFEKGRMEVRNKFFIWKRHRPKTKLIDRVRFWADVGLLFTFDLLHLFRRPWHIANLKHAAGLLFATWQCVLAPPQHSEPEARREYQLAVEP
jgi:GT2 family glycosyltransferase